MGTDYRKQLGGYESSMKPFAFISPLSDSERKAFLKLRMEEYRKTLAQMEQEFKTLENRTHENSEYRSR